MATATDRQKTAKENFTIPDAGERKVSLLVVEDDENISTAISEYFSRAGYSVRTVEDGLNGVKAALDDPPDAVVLDLMLPKMDGLAVCKELREKVGYLPILMLTAKDDVVDKVLGLEMGADDYITKPFSLRELEARIKSLSETGRLNSLLKSLIFFGSSPRTREGYFHESICLKRSGTTLTKATIGRSTPISIVSEPKSRRILRILKWSLPFGGLATSSATNNKLFVVVSP